MQIVFPAAGRWCFREFYARRWHDRRGARTLTQAAFQASEQRVSSTVRVLSLFPTRERSSQARYSVQVSSLRYGTENAKQTSSREALLTCDR